jgi:hypothetical protein
MLTFNEVFYALLTISQRVQERPSHPNGFRAQAQSLDDIGTAPNTAVNVDFEVLKDFWMMTPDLKKCQKRGRRSACWSEDLNTAWKRGFVRVEIASSMVSYDDAVETMFHGKHGVFGCLNTFRQNRQLGRFSQPLDVVPVERVVNVCAHRSSETSTFIVVRRSGTTYRSFGVCS